jgi:hypothetical protein
MAQVRCHKIRLATFAPERTAAGQQHPYRFVAQHADLAFG